MSEASFATGQATADEAEQSQPAAAATGTPALQLTLDDWWQRKQDQDAHAAMEVDHGSESVAKWEAWMKRSLAQGAKQRGASSQHPPPHPRHPHPHRCSSTAAPRQGIGSSTSRTSSNQLGQRRSRTHQLDLCNNAQSELQQIGIAAAKTLLIIINTNSIIISQGQSRFRTQS